MDKRHKQEIRLARMREKRAGLHKETRKALDDLIRQAEVSIYRLAKNAQR